MSYRLTFRQKKALKRLFELHQSYPANDHGFFPSSIGTLNAQAFRTPEMQASGMIIVDRMAANCFRYRLTAAGIAFAEFLSKPQDLSSLGS
jgi:hypothetical protein